MLGRALDHVEEWLIATLIAAATIWRGGAGIHRVGTGASIDLSTGVPEGDASVVWSLKAKPRFAGVPLPGRGYVDGGARVVLRKNAIGVVDSGKLHIGLR